MALLSVLHTLNYSRDSGAPPSPGLRLEYSWRNKVTVTENSATSTCQQISHLTFYYECNPTGSIIVTKTGLESTDQAKLYLYDSDDNLIQTSPQTVSNNGQASWSNLPYGNYYIEEDFNGITNVYT
jgi:hypothetical protein